jgi:hypothetical protein
MGAWRDTKSGRRVWVVDAARVDDWPEPPPWESAGFALLFAAEHVVDVAALAERAVARGLAFACAWGPGCVMIEDAFDEAIVAHDREESADDVRLTTSHADESLEEALEFFLDAATPSVARRETCGAWVVFPIGAALRARVERALKRRGAQQE